jgi:hypothetical protein
MISLLMFLFGLLSLAGMIGLLEASEPDFVAPNPSKALLAAFALVLGLSGMSLCVSVALKVLP